MGSTFGVYPASRETHFWSRWRQRYWKLKCIDVVAMREALMSGDVRQVIESHHCYFEVSPYSIVTEDRPVGGAVSVRRVQAGFDFDIFGVKMSSQPDPAAEYWLVYTRLKEVVDAVRHENNQACFIEVIPFGSTIVLDTRNHLQPMVMLRIRVTHNGDIHEPAGAAEQQAVKAVEAQLSTLGMPAGRSRA
jgi:hypothetical protein